MSERLDNFAFCHHWNDFYQEINSSYKLIFYFVFFFYIKNGSHFNFSCKIFVTFLILAPKNIPSTIYQSIFNLPPCSGHFENLKSFSTGSIRKKKRLVSSIKDFMYELPNELPNNVKLKEISRKCQNCIVKHPCVQSFQ